MGRSPDRKQVGKQGQISLKVTRYLASSPLSLCFFTSFSIFSPLASADRLLIWMGIVREGGEESRKQPI
jgi:hypothetical protein